MKRVAITGASWVSLGLAVYATAGLYLAHRHGDRPACPTSEATAAEQLAEAAEEPAAVRSEEYRKMGLKALKNNDFRTARARFEAAIEIGGRTTDLDELVQLCIVLERESMAPAR